MIEIERKFLVDSTQWEELIKPNPMQVTQAYLLNQKDKNIRVRIKGQKGYLTIKGDTKGLTRSEFEYEIPCDDAKSLIQEFAEKVIQKDRYEIRVGEHLWEVDVFHGKLAGLIIAEIELSHEEEVFSKPAWITKEVSYDPAYFNAKLIERC